MRELIDIGLDSDALTALEPEELGAKLLVLARQRLLHGPKHHQSMIHPGNEVEQLRQHPAYREGWDDIGLALTEAWAWLEAQALVVPAEGMNGGNGWRRLSRRAKSFDSEDALRPLAFIRRIPREALHPRIAPKVWAAFVRNEFDTAVFQAMKAVEIAVREAARLPADIYGTTLMRRAFDPKQGPLTDLAAEPSEREARAALFAGAIGALKNPHSHREVSLTDAVEAFEIVMLANHLLRIVDSRVAAASATTAAIGKG